MVDIAADVEHAVQALEARRMALRAHLADTKRPPGLVAVDDKTFMAAVDTMIAQFPRQQVRTPDGRVVFESPWMVMLGVTDKDGHEVVAGGGDVLHRIELIQAKYETAQGVA